MHIIKNEEVASILSVADAIAVMRQAFLQYGLSGAMQERVRIDCGKSKLSMMGAIIPGINAVGAKIYTTINGKFAFVVLLFSADDGALLAVMEGDAMTEYRTAAVTAIAADALARKDAKTLAVFGTGVQARSHVAALLSIRSFSEVLVVGIDRPGLFAEEMTSKFAIACRVTSAEEAASSADVLITATRSATPLFDGNDVKPGAFVAAIGSSKPEAREVDDNLVRRASRIVVEWKQQAKTEAGDLLLCAKDCFDWQNVLELTDVVSQPNALRHDASEIILYKAIGVGLEDVALAEHIYRQMRHSPCTDKIS